MYRKLNQLFILILLLLPMTVRGQQAGTITGTVTDQSGEPLIGVSVLVKGTTTGCSTGIDGDFTIKANTGNTLVFSYLGYATKEVKATGSTLNVTLEENSQQLDEVVVTAMGIQRKESSLTYATQIIKGDELMKVQDANFVNSLSGKVSGVTITQSAGGAGGASKILLRGNKSVMGNNAPLIVIDGIPMTNQVKGSSNWDGGTGLDYASSSEGGDALSLINPDDIESINVLKGANAAALYGSAAANGVLMITTKKGKEGKIAVTVNSNVNFEQPLATPALQGIYGSVITMNAATGEAIGMQTGAWGKKIGTYTDAELAYANTQLRNYYRNNVSEFFRTGTTWNNSVSVSGGTEKVRSYFSYANSNSHGMMPNNLYNRNTFSFRQNYSLFKNKLKMDIAINYVNAKTQNRPGGGTVMNPLYDLYRLPGNVDFRYYRDHYVNPEGTWLSNDITYLDEGGKSHQDNTTLEGPKQIWAYSDAAGNNNPYWLTGMNRSTQVEQRVYGSAMASYEIIPGLMVQGRLNVDRASFKGFTNRYATTQNVTQMEDFGIYGQDLYSSDDWYVDFMASYNKTFKDDYSVSASTGWVGHTVKGTNQKQWVKATYYDALALRGMPTRVNYFEPTALWWNNNGLSWGNSSNWDKGWFLTGQLGWKDMLYLEGSYRIDWYRAFLQFKGRGTPDHYGYWSLGVNTLMHKYLPLPEQITHLKLRTSYSEVGNSIPNEVFAKASKNLTTGSLTTPTYGYFDNPLPEKSKSFEAGFDISLFNSDLNWDLTYYNTNLTNSYFLAATTGGKSKPVNTGSIRNQGFESTISYNVIAGRDWIWRTGFNVAFNDNKIKKTYTDNQGLPAKMEQLIAKESIAVRYAEGGSYGDIYALDFRRNDDGSIYIDPTVGTPVKSNTDWVYLGNMNSKWNLGWSNTISWKDLSLYFLINGRVGGKFISLTEAYLDNAGMSKRTADARLTAERKNIVWTSDDGTTSKPGMYAHGTLVPIEDYYKTVGGQTIASEYVYDATNFRLGEVSISYSLRNICRGFIKNLTLSAVGRNLFFIYKASPSDPDIALSTKNGLGAFDIFNMPSARSYGINLKLEF
ncbi:MAG: SusC/RagA family TonB-linked outer membrane protein [Coprobacter sp.]|nr:SusC/RagA family TonB-linked outer membrane protein [Coprobacter sp.]